MALTVNTNLAAQQSWRHLGRSTSDLTQRMKNLSSGLRVNKAADDAAGLAVAENLDAAEISSRQASRNILDGISAIETAESATSEVQDVWQRLRELAVQASSETLHDTERQYIQQEASQLMAESQRIAKTTAFNGTKLLQEEAEATSMSDLLGWWKFDETSGVTVSDSIGSNDGELQNVDPATVWEAGKKGNAAHLDGSDDWVSLGTKGSSSDIGGRTNVTLSMWVKPDEVGEKDYFYSSRTHSLRAEVETGSPSESHVGVRTANSSSQVATLDDPNNLTADQWYHLAISYDGATAKVFVNGDEVASDSSLSGALQASSGHPRLGGYTSVTGLFDGSIDDVRTYGKTLTSDEIRTISNENEGGSNNVNLNVQVGIHDTDNDRIAVDFGNIGTASLYEKTGNTSDIRFDTVENARKAIGQVDKVLDVLSSFRSKYGASMNRMQSALESSEVLQENTATAQSRIRDADFAFETAQMSRAQIMQQAGVAVLGQANGMNQSILRLL